MKILLFYHLNQQNYTRGFTAILVSGKLSRDLRRVDFKHVEAARAEIDLQLVGGGLELADAAIFRREIPKRLVRIQTGNIQHCGVAGVDIFIGNHQ